MKNLKHLGKGTLTTVVIAMVSIIYGVIDFLFEKYAPDISSSLANALIVGLLFLILEKVLELGESRLHEQDKSIFKFVQKAGGGKSVNGEVCLSLTEKHSKAIGFNQDCTEFFVTNEEWSLDTYGTFWENLKGQIRSLRTNDSDSDSQCFAIHSSNLDIWLDEMGEQFLRHQKAFIEAGGQIKRILCYEGSGNENPKLKEVALKMKNVGIEVYYCNIEKIPKLLAWDFLIVNNQAVVWTDLHHPKRIPRKAVYTNNGKYDDRDLLEFWKKIREESEPFSF